MEEKIYTINNVAQIMNVCRGTVFYWIRKGRLKGFRPSGPHGHLRFKESDVEAIMLSKKSSSKKKKQK